MRGDAGDVKKREGARERMGEWASVEGETGRRGAEELREEAMRQQAFRVPTFSRSFTDVL